MNELDDFQIIGKPKNPIKMPTTTSLMLVVVVMIAALVSLGEFTLTLTGIVNVSVMVVVLYIIASVVYNNSYTEHIAKAKLLPEYSHAKDEFDKACKAIYDRGLLTELPELCIRYSREDLKNARTSLLLDACIPYELYEKEYLGKSTEALKSMDLPEDAIKCITAANRVKGMRLTAAALLSYGEEQTLAERIMRTLGFRRGIGIESKTRQQIDMGTNMISRALTTLLAGAVGVNIVMDDFSLKTIALWALKMLPIATAAISGASGGTRNVTDTLIPQLERKTKIIKTILTWIDLNPKAAQESIPEKSDIVLTSF